MIWQFDTRHEPGTGAIHARVREHGTPVTFARLLEAWCKIPDLRSQWVAFMRAVPFKAYCWENPPLSVATTHGTYECVFVEVPALAVAVADIEPFAGVLTGSEGSVTFPNLGGDAVLVAPCRADRSTDYAHMAAFMRSAPADQAAQLWQEVGTALVKHLAYKSTWLNTAGLGVSWVHVRLDSRPKYYRYRPYAEPGFQSARA